MIWIKKLLHLYLTNTIIYQIYYFSLIKGLIRVYTIRDIKQISEKEHGIIVISGITISILLSLFVQLSFIDKVSF